MFLVCWCLHEIKTWLPIYAQHKQILESVSQSHSLIMREKGRHVMNPKITHWSYLRNLIRRHLQNYQSFIIGMRHKFRINLVEDKRQH